MQYIKHCTKAKRDRAHRGRGAAFNEGSTALGFKKRGWVNMERGEKPHIMRDMNHFPSKYQGGQNTTNTGRQNIRKRIEVYSCL